jgi:hypothetical protein
MSLAAQLLRLLLLGGACLLAAAPAAPGPDRLFPADERLDAPVTLPVRGRPLAETLAGMGGPGAPRLAAGRDAAWERVTIFPRGQPLREVMAGLGELLDVRWQTSGEAPPARYTVARDRRAEEYERRLWRATLEAGAAPLFRLAGCARRPPEAWDREREALGGQAPAEPLLRSGNLGYLSRPASHAALQLVETLSPAERWTLLDAGRCLLPWDSMTSRQRQLARAMLDDPLRFGANLARGEDPDDPKVVQRGLAESQAWIEQFGLALLVETDPATGAVAAYEAGPGGMRGGYGVFEQLGAGQPLLPVRGCPYEQWPHPRHAVYPELERVPFPAPFRVEASQRRDWPRLLEELARRVPMPIYSDDYPGSRAARADDVAPWPGGEKQTLPEGLDALCEATGHLWWWKSGALFFRGRTWFVEKQYEAPPPVVAAVATHLGTPPQVDASLLRLLSGFTLRQLQGLARGTAAARSPEDRQAAREGVPMDTLRISDYLQFFRALPEPQQRRALSPAGLPLRQMTAAQAKTFLRLAVLHDGREVLDQFALFRFQVASEPLRPTPPPGPSDALLLLFSYSPEAHPTRFLVRCRPAQPEPAPRTSPSALPSARS